MSADQMPAECQSSGSSGWRRARAAFRWFRIAVLAVALFGAGLVVWSNLVGVPSQVAQWITAELRRKNVSVEFSRLRLQGLSHLVANDLKIASAGESDRPRVEAREAELLVDFRKLRAGEIEVSGLRFNQAVVLVPLHETNEAPRFLAISNIVSDVDLLPDDVIRVTRASAEALGAKASAGGEVRNFSRLRLGAGPGGPESSWPRMKRQLREVTDIFESLEFSEPPRITLSVFGNAVDPSDLRASITLASASARSRWGRLEKLTLFSSIYPSATNDAVAGAFSLNARGFDTPWGELGEATLTAETVWARQVDELVTNRVSFEASEVKTRWGDADRLGGTLSSGPQAGTNVILSALAAHASELVTDGRVFGASELEAQLRHALPMASPAAWFRQLVQGTPARAELNEVAGEWQLRSTGIALPNSTLDSIALSGELSSRDLHAGLSGLDLSWRLAVSNILSQEISVGSLTAKGRWAQPELSLANLEARLYGGSLSGSASLAMDARVGEASLRGDFDYQRIALLLDRPVQKWLEQFSWETPPQVEARIGFRFPEWTNSWEGIEREVVRTIGIDGALHGSGTFAGIPVLNATTSFQFTNYVWSLPDLKISRPEGVSTFAYTGNVTNGEFSCELELRLDPAALRPVLPKEAHLAFDLVQFPEAPRIAGRAQGDWDEKEAVTFRGSFAASNFVARGIKVLDLGGEMFYSNLVLEAWNVSAHMGTGAVRAPYLRMDIPAEVMFVTNVASTVNPYDAMHIVGPEPYDAIDPYRFAQPPAVVVNGYVPLRDVDKADLWFDVAGHDFTFWRFRAPHLTGLVHWRGSELWITNVQASFYRGQARWAGYFYIHDDEDRADYQFTGSAVDADLKLLVADVFGMTNQMEGRLTGNLVITSADSANERSWNGYGEATMSDGFLWNVPVFGVFTPVLDALVPGEGMSRVTAGTGHFRITNSVVHTRDLQVRTRAFRLNYKGSVDLEGQLDALVEAEIFRDAWLLGKAFSVVLWPVSKAFEARISGQAREPKTQLRYFPRFLLAPFRALSELGREHKSLEKNEKQSGNPAGLGPEDPRPPSP